MDLYFIKPFPLPPFPLHVEKSCSTSVPPALKLLYTTSKNPFCLPLSFLCFYLSILMWDCRQSGMCHNDTWGIALDVFPNSILSALVSAVISPLSTQRMASQNYPPWPSHPCPQW